MSDTLAEERDTANLSRMLTGSHASHSNEINSFVRKQFLRFAGPSSQPRLDSSSGDQANDSALITTCPVCMETPESPVIIHCGHVLCEECANSTLKYSTHISGTMGLQASTVIGANRLKLKSASCPICRQAFTAKDLTFIKPKVESHLTWFDILNQVILQSDEARKINNFYYSSKLRCLDYLLSHILAQGRRCVVFSQWCKLLDIVERLMIFRKIPYNRLDGSQSSSRRRAEIDAFKTTAPEEFRESGPELNDFFPDMIKDAKPTLDNEDCVTIRWAASDWEPGKFKVSANAKVLLASLKAGGVGLDLTVANYLVLLDSWWNPAVEEQAMQRIYRIGQKLPVVIFRLYVEKTIEESILELHKKKDHRAKGVLQDSHTRPVSEQTSRRLWTIEEMKHIFKI